MKYLITDGYHAFMQTFYEVSAAPVDANDIHNAMWDSWMSLMTLATDYVAGQVTLYFFNRREEEQTLARR
jgi:hypothetical protein